MKSTFRLLFFLFGIGLYSCSQPSDSDIRFASFNKQIDWIDEKNIMEGEALINFKPASKELDEILAYTGIDPIGSFEVFLNTNNAKYTPFIAVYNCPPTDPIKKSYSSSDVELIDYQFYNGCFIYPLVKDSMTTTFEKEKLTYDFAFDKKSSSILKNDSLYFCLQKGRFETFPIEASVSSYIINETSTVWSQDEPMVMFILDLYRKDGDKDSMTKAILGFVSYDCNTKYDWESIFETKELKYKAFMMELQPGFYEPLNLNDFKI